MTAIYHTRARSLATPPPPPKAQSLRLSLSQKPNPNPRLCPRLCWGTSPYALTRPDQELSFSATLVNAYHRPLPNEHPAIGDGSLSSYPFMGKSESLL